MNHDRPGAWVAFARTGKPDHPGIPHWPLFIPTSRMVNEPLWDVSRILGPVRPRKWKREEQAMSKTIVVTGASTGIGYATSLALAKAGYDVFAGVRSLSAGEPLVKAASSLPGKITPILLEVTDQAQVDAAGAQVKASLGGEPLFGLVNNAGIAHGGPLLHQSIDQIRQVMEVNVIGLIRVTQAFAPLMAATATSAARPGRIVNISSVAGKFGGPFLGAYVASKHAVEGLSETLRRELMLHGIDVIIIGPGAVQTAIWDKAETADIGYLAGTPYAGSAAQFNTYVIRTGRQGLKPERLGQVVLKALTTDKPKTRYAVAKNALADWILPQILPKRVVDRTIAKQMGFTPLGGAERRGRSKGASQRGQRVL